MEQYTVFGTIEDVSDIEENKFVTKHKKLTIKQKFRLKYGFDEKVYCKNCVHCIKVDTNNKHYYKCEVMGISSSTATDIRLKDYGCSKYENKEEIL